MNIYCPKCESANYEDVAVCSLCGHQLQHESSLDTSTVDESETDVLDADLLRALQDSVVIHQPKVYQAKTDVVIAATGVNGQLEMTDFVVRIKRKGGLAFLTQGLKGDKEILISHVSSIQFKKAEGMNGYIQFAYVGGREAKGGLFEATCDENTIMFNAEQQRSFEIFRDFLQKRMQSNSKPSSSLDELEKLASLREKGIVTEEEFQAKKKQILGL